MPEKTKTKTKTFSDEERAAMRERAKEAKAAARGADGMREVLAKIAEMQGSDRTMAEQIHEIVQSAAPELSPRTWYGMPAYADEGGVVCYFKPALKFKTRYATLGFSDKANIDDGTMWPTEYALTKVTGDVEKRIRALVKQAVS